MDIDVYREFMTPMGHDTQTAHERRSPVHDGSRAHNSSTGPGPWSRPSWTGTRTTLFERDSIAANGYATMKSVAGLQPWLQLLYPTTTAPEA